MVEFMENMLQLPPIPTSILGISDIIIEGAQIDNNGNLVINVKNAEQEIKCSQCNAPTSPHGHGRIIKLRHLPVFGHKTYIHIAPARGICTKCDNHPTTTQNNDWYNTGSGYTKAYEQQILFQLINSTIREVVPIN